MNRQNRKKNQATNRGGRQGHTNTRGSSNSTSNQMDQKTALHKNLEGRGWKNIKVMWDSVTFGFTSKQKFRQQESLCLDIGKVQFALTSYRKEKSVKTLKENGICVNINDKHIEVKFGKQLKEIDEMQYLEMIFETCIINDLERIEIDQESSEEKRLNKEALEEMQQKYVEVYHCQASNTLFVVGERTEVQKIFLKKENSKGAEPFQKYLSLTDSYLLKYLRFEDHVSVSIPGAKVHLSHEPPYCMIKGSESANINVDHELRTFLDKIETKPLTLSCALVEKLFFDPHPKPNDSVYSFITKCLPKSLKNVLFYISKSDTGEFFVNCLNEKNAEKVAEMVEKSIVSTKFNVTGLTVEWKFLKLWSSRKKLFYTNISTELIELCCTTDAYESFCDVDSSSRLSLSDNQLRFLRLFGREFLVDIEKRYGICATVTESALELTGKSRTLEKSKEFINTKLIKHRKSIPLDVPIECIENRKDEIDTAMKKVECFWNLKYMKTPVKMLKNCDYLASWIDPMREIKVTVVKGFSWHMDLDLQIVMANQSLYPIEITKYHLNGVFPPKAFPVPEDFISRGKEIIENKEGKMVVGEYTRPLKELDGTLNVSCVALVVSSDFSHEISEQINIKQSIKEILKENVKSSITNFGISAFDGAPNVTVQVIEAALEFAEASPGQIDEMFICCQTEQTHELLKVHALFKDKFGFVQKIYSDSAKIGRTAVSDTKIKVSEGSIAKLKADVIVNTTNKLLKLETGVLSSTILKMAGLSLQDECKTKYPGGLKKGQVAKTKAYNLSNLKFIYHISLPRYNEATFREVVKMYVKKCLCLAERDGCCSIAFPALGVGKLKYPRRETAEAMFDAAEEYSLEVINPILKSIEFLVNVSDEMTHEAFRHEEYRRSKRCLKEIGLTKPFIRTDFRFLVFKTEQTRPSIKITTLQEFGVPPAYAVEVFIGFVKTGEKIYQKRAFDEPPSWNDRWFLKRAETVKKVTMDLRKFINHLADLDDRVTEIVIYTNKDSKCNISEEQQVQSICRVFSKTKMDFLQEVIIVVSNDPSLQRTAKLLRIDNKLAIDKKNSYNESNERSIELIGKTRQCLTDGETFIMELLKTIKEEIATKIVSRLTMDTGTQMLQQQVTMDSLDSNNEFEVYDEVTAEINHGIVDFKEKNNDWDDWVEKVEKVFRLKVNASSQDKVTVKGDFKCILRFEQYLDKHFPATPTSYVS